MRDHRRRLSQIHHGGVGSTFIASVSIFHPFWELSLFNEAIFKSNLKNLNEQLAEHSSLSLINLTHKELKDLTASLRVTRGIERTFLRPFAETFRISKNEDFNGPYLENENEFLKNSFETVSRASKSCDRDQLVSAFQLTFKLKQFCKVHVVRHNLLHL